MDYELITAKDNSVLVERWLETYRGTLAIVLRILDWICGLIIAVRFAGVSPQFDAVGPHKNYNGFYIINKDFIIYWQTIFSFC